jgi:hypothetical protein
MKQKLVTEIAFSPDIRDKWPSLAFSAEAYLLEEGHAPWSVRAELWAPPDATGKAFAWLSFLSESAPYAELPLGSSFELKMGRTALGQATLRVFPKTTTAFKENDFIGDPAAPVRSAA